MDGKQRRPGVLYELPARDAPLSDWLKPLSANVVNVHMPTSNSGVAPRARRRNVECADPGPQAVLARLCRERKTVAEIAAELQQPEDDVRRALKRFRLTLGDPPRRLPVRRAPAPRPEPMAETPPPSAPAAPPAPEPPVAAVQEPPPPEPAPAPAVEPEQAFPTKAQLRAHRKAGRDANAIAKLTGFTPSEIGAALFKAGL